MGVGVDAGKRAAALDPRRRHTLESGRLVYGRRMARQSQPAVAPSEPELLAIVRAADVLVMRASCAGLARVLKGSRASEVVARGWHRLPVHGILSDRTLDEIRGMIDWTVAQGYLQLVRERGVWWVCLGSSGWELVRQLYVDQILVDFAQKAEEPHQLGDYMYLQELNPEILAQVCDEIRRRDTPGLAPVLRAWRGFALPTVQRRIDRVLAAIEPRA